MKKHFITVIAFLAFGLIVSNGFGSGDRTKRRVVKQGDTLVSMTKEVYGRPGLVLAVARINNIPNGRVLPIGLLVVFPPMESIIKN